MVSERGDDKVGSSKRPGSDGLQIGFPHPSTPHAFVDAINHRDDRAVSIAPAIKATRLLHQ